MTRESAIQATETDEQALAQTNSVSRLADQELEAGGVLQRNRDILLVITLQILIIFTMLIFVTVYGRLHGLPAGLDTFGVLRIEDVEKFNQQVSNFRFVGTSEENPEPSFYSVWLEVFVWSFAGVMARELYYLTMVGAKNVKVDFLKTVSKIIGEAAMGIAIAIAAIAFLRAAQLTIGDVDLTLRTASIEFIGATAFILGFYHEDTRRLLGSIRKRVADSDEKKRASSEESSV